MLRVLEILALPPAQNGFIRPLPSTIITATECPAGIILKAWLL